MDHGRRDSFINLNSIPPQYDFFGMSQDVTQNSFVEPPKPVRQSTYEPGDEERFNFIRFAPYIPKVFHPYISSTVDVRGDGNCGFRSVAVGLGLPEHEWQFIRSELYQELTGRKEIYEAIFGCFYFNLKESLPFYELSFATQPKWLIIPETGVLIANRLWLRESERQMMRLLILREKAHRRTTRGVVVSRSSPGSAVSSRY
ncbi:hypothetical protein QVD17_19911 [Tagetes erecta]|uniref:OTU domain-containing protein n=1 Tax=Tagetes erecta TaxID=13708 RepID=A0AAD8NWW3_TARER|nr:hypothetical protein QVD17_19911 [Tagetes erecta]